MEDLRAELETATAALREQMASWPYAYRDGRRLPRRRRAPGAARRAPTRSIDCAPAAAISRPASPSTADRVASSDGRVARTPGRDRRPRAREHAAGLGPGGGACRPPAREARGELRATVGRLAHERFTDERVGELLADGGAARRARGRRRERRPARLRQGPSRPRRARRRDGARRGGRARGLAAGARGQRLRALRALPGAQHRAAPALQRVLPRGRAPLRPAARRLRAGHAHGRAARRPRAPARRPRPARGGGARGRRRGCCAWARSPRPASARWLGIVLRAVGVDERAVAPRRGDPPVRGDDRRARTCG